MQRTISTEALGAMPQNERSADLIKATRVVAITHTGLYLELLMRLAAHLKSEYGSRIHWYVPRPEAVATVERHDLAAALESIEVMPEARSEGRNAKERKDKYIAEARRIEATYGTSINRYAVTDRHLGRGFAPGGFFFPRSRQAKNNDYWDLLATYCDYVNYWERQFDEKGLSLLITSGWMEADVAKVHGAPVRRPMSSRYKNLHFWATDGFGDSSHMPDAFERHLASNDAGEYEELVAAPYVQGKLKAARARPDLATQMLGNIVRKLRNYAYYSIKGHSKASEYLLSDELRFFVREWLHARRMMSDDLPQLKDLQGQDFVYFPLQVDPEFGFQGQSPEFFFQHAAAVALARDLPAGVILAIKEHLPALGGRPWLFYEQLRELKNVALLDVRESSLELIKASRAVVSITGTVGQEAAVMGKPVITFGRHNVYNCMPQVHVATDIGDLTGVISQALSEEHSVDAARQAGTAYLAALREISFDLEQMSHESRGGFGDQAFARAVESLFEGIDLERAAVGA